MDTVARIDEQLAAAAAQVAIRHGLAPKWLNDSAAAFRPRTLDETACAVLLEHPRLRVLGAPFRDVFLMKLLAGRAADQADLVTLWPLSGFISAEEAATEMYAAFPAAPDDPHLADYVAAIGRESDARD